jgi:methyl-accepting chemotaxis protein
MGDAGRGCAVVALEVKNLAGQTAKATDEISAHIVNMQRATGESVGAIKAIGQTIERISGITTSISSAVEQQGTATQASRKASRLPPLAPSMSLTTSSAPRKMPAKPERHRG